MNGKISPADMATSYTVENMDYGEIAMYNTSFQDTFLNLVEE